MPKKVDVRIIRVHGGNANWFVKKIEVEAGGKVTWYCKHYEIFVWFTDKHALKLGKVHVHGTKGQVSVDVGTKKGRYFYAMMIKDDNGEMHLVEGNSPPEMVIE
jgi:hypothetical protein